MSKLQSSLILSSRIRNDSTLSKATLGGGFVFSQSWRVAERAVKSMSI
ncbi:hypothetical protein [Lactococcus phage D7893]